MAIMELILHIYPIHNFPIFLGIPPPNEKIKANNPNKKSLSTKARSPVYVSGLSGNSQQIRERNVAIENIYGSTALRGGLMFIIG